MSTSATEVINDPNVDVVFIATPHDTHADLVVEALEAGKHVFCEKPLAMTEEELDRIEMRSSSGKVLQVGFNRRHAPAIVKAKEVLGSSGGPLVITYRVNAGELPDSHWYKDRRFGGRLIGEACHYIDLCGFLCDDQQPEVHLFGSGVGEKQLAEDFIISLRYPDGSLATITYGSAGHPSMPKERIEVVGRGHSIEIDQVQSLSCDGLPVRLGSVGAGHEQQLRSLGARLRGVARSRVGIALTGSICTTRSLLRGYSTVSGR